MACKRRDDISFDIAHAKHSFHSSFHSSIDLCDRGQTRNEYIEDLQNNCIVLLKLFLLFELYTGTYVCVWYACVYANI